MTACGRTWQFTCEKNVALYHVRYKFVTIILYIYCINGKYIVIQYYYIILLQFYVYLYMWYVLSELYNFIFALILLGLKIIIYPHRVINSPFITSERIYASVQPSTWRGHLIFFFFSDCYIISSHGRPGCQRTRKVRYRLVFRYQDFCVLFL